LFHVSVPDPVIDDPLLMTPLLTRNNWYALTHYWFKQ